MSTTPITTRSVSLAHGRLHVADRPGEDPPFVLMHGFPDDSRIYHRLAPRLAPHRVVAFDFMGYGRSDRPDPGALDAGHHQAALAAVLDTLGLEQAVVVAHDASGPVAIDVALDDPGRVRHLALLNTFYGHAPSFRLPEMIQLLADQRLTPLADAMVDDPDQRLWLLAHTARHFEIDAHDPEGIAATSIVPQFFGDGDTPDALVAIRSWTAALFEELDRQDHTIAAGELRRLDLPVTLVFGADDDYLGPELGGHLTSLFTHSDLHIVEDASHWPQWDRPDVVAALIRQATII